MRTYKQYENTINKKKVLILCPPPVERGGVAEYYRLVKKYFDSDRIDIDFYYTGKSSTGGIGKSRVIKFCKDFIGLMKILNAKDLVVFNPSLDPRAVIRDGVYHFLAKRVFRKNTLVFIHGWDLCFEQVICKYARKIFRILFNFDRGLVLAKQFKNTLVGWGYNPQCLTVETTFYEAHDCHQDKDLSRIVYLSRFEQGKGCLEAIKSVELLSKEFTGIKLFMAGDGTLTPELKKYVNSHNLKNNVTFTGWMDGDEKYKLLRSCGIMLYPTFYGEGMPICVLEGMGMGLVVITRPVAGIRDILVDGENGYLIDSQDPKEYADRMKYLLLNATVGQNMAQKSKREAELRYEIKNVTKRMEQIYFETGQ